MSWNPVRLDVAPHAEAPLVPAHLGVHSQGALFPPSLTRGSVPLLAQQLSTPRFHCSAAPGGRLPPAPTEQPWAGAERSRSCRTPAVQFPSPLKHKKSFAMGSRTAKPDLSLFSFLTLIGVHSKLNL